MSEITLTIDGEKKKYPAGTSFEQIADEYQSRYDGQIALVAENGTYRELHKKIKKDATIDFITFKDVSGHKTYVRTAILILMKALDDELKNDKSKQFKVEFVVGNGYYVKPLFDTEITDEFVENVKKRMMKMVEDKLPIVKSSLPTAEARALFAEAGMNDKDRLFKFRRGSSVNIYDLDGYKDYFYGYMMPNAGYIKYFDLKPYKMGLVLLLPDASEPTTVRPFVPREKLFNALWTGEGN